MDSQLFLYSFVFSSVFGISATLKDSISPGESIREGTTLVSADSSFELGFFNPPNSKNRYLGIWYKKISTGTVVWVANRVSPLTDSSVGILEINGQGTLILHNGTNLVFWTSNTTRNNAAAAQNPVAQLLDSGNFVVKDPENILWQSFDYPGDTFLPGMKLGRNLVTGLDRYISSWKSTEDPAPGDFSYRVDPLGFPQVLIRKGSKTIYRSGSWNGLTFTGAPALKPNPIYTFEFVANQTDVYYTYELRNTSVVSKLVMNESGIMQRFTWIDKTNSWSLFLTLHIDNCDDYALCGAYASCNINNSPVCTCLSGFQPKSPRDWDLVDWLEGCVRTTPLNCTNGDGFVKFAGLKLPDTSYSWYNKSMGLQECRELCLKKCNCSGYANSDIREGGSGCLLWFGDLVDMREFADNDFGQDLYIKMSELDHIGAKRHSIEKKHIGIIVSSVMLVMGMLILGMIFYIKKRKPKRQEMSDESGQEDMELPMFDLATIANATDNFSSNKKLGEGGFGPVYKGTLIGGQEIAVKRLSKNSGQGRKEFKNEVILIAKLQHRNLVKILGCCIQGNENLLIYEYLPNRSLDSIIFDKKRSKLLDWRMRIHIICGIARGLLYLHQDSRLRIIHRDLKTSNVLLDAYMNPKISDFGLARAFGGDQSQANTKRVVGTYGYMSPEYTVDGLLSVKSDVYSFGVIVLEILSGKKNRGFVHQDHQLNLLGHAWKLWTQGKPLELVDKLVGDESSAMSEVLRCIHVGLLCVQQRPEDRPNMSSVVLMLGSETSLPQPKQPGFFTERNALDQTNSSSSKQESYSSTNQASITLLEAR